MKDFWKNSEKKNINIKKILVIAVISILLITFIITAIVYINNKEARDWIDKNVLKKQVTQNNLSTIELNESENQDICAFNKYIGVLNKNIFHIYEGTGREEAKLTVEITKPIFNSNGRHIVIAEEKGQKLYLVTDKDIAWEKSVEGNIAQVKVNKNGYVAVTIVDTSYKTVVAMFDNSGEELFYINLSSTRVADVSISNDNKYLALAEIDTSGTIIQSNIRIISIEDGRNNPKNSIKKIYNGENNELITNIEYQDKDKLICMYTNKVTLIKSDETIETITENDNKKISFVSIELSNAIATIEEKSSGLFTADSILNITDTNNKNTATYITESVAKEIYTSNNVVALNLGAEVEFIDTNGWLVKKYIAEQEITNIVLSSSIAGIIYRDKIEIVNL